MKSRVNSGAVNNARRFAANVSQRPAEAFDVSRSSAIKTRQ